MPYIIKHSLKNKQTSTCITKFVSEIFDNFSFLELHGANLSIASSSYRDVIMRSVVGKSFQYSLFFRGGAASIF